MRSLVQEGRVAELGGHEVTLIAVQQHRRRVTEIDAGAAVTVRVTAHPPAAERYHGGAQVRHLESGTLIYRGQSGPAGAAPITLDASRGIEIDWRFKANFGRGHYGVSCAILDERQRWVAVSAPILLTVNERQSEQALVFLQGTCEMRPLPSRSVVSTQ